MIFAHDFRGALTTHKIPAAKMVTGEYYKEHILTLVLLNKLRYHAHFQFSANQIT